MRPISEAKCPDLRGSVVAMERAALLARMVAIQTNTCIAIVRDGRIVLIPPDVLRDELRNKKKSKK
jgi:hypothetical protein